MRLARNGTQSWRSLWWPRHPRSVIGSSVIGSSVIGSYAPAGIGLWLALAPALAGCGGADAAALGQPSEGQAAQSQAADGQAALSQLQQPIIGGALDESTSGVVGLALDLGSRVAGHCSGTLIAPNLVLTARHCVALT